MSNMFRRGQAAKIPVRPAFILLLFALPLLMACGNLSGEPEIIRTMPTPVIIDESMYPSEAPDLEKGREIFAANCISCHGQFGQGDGELVRSGEVMNPGSFHKPANREDQTPLDFFKIITNGKLGSLMPPWSGSLSTEDRWNVAMYVYSLRYAPDQIRAGQQIAMETGLTEPLEARFGDLRNPASLLDIAGSALQATLISETDGLTETQLSALTAYARSLLFGAEALSGFLAQQQDEQEQTQHTITVQGTIENGTDGASVPTDLTVTLEIFEQATLEDPETFTTELSQDGNDMRFTFTGIPGREGAVYIVSVNYQGRDFAAPFQIDQDQREINAPITIFETSTDTSNITINRIIAEIRGIKSAQTGDMLEVRYEMALTNGSDRMLTSGDNLPDGRPISIEIPLPPASVPIPDGTDRFFFDDNTFTLYDTRGIQPGESVIRFVFLVPYDRAAIIEYPVPYPLDGQMIVLLNTEVLNITSDQLIEIDRNQVELDAKAYANNLALAADDLIRFEVTGAIPEIGTSIDSDVTTSNNLLPVLGGGATIIILLLAVGMVLLRRSGSAQERNTDSLINGLVKQIEALDVEHDAGRINHDVYRRRRAELQARLDELTGSE